MDIIIITFFFIAVDVPEDAKDSKTEEGIRKRFEITDKDKDGRLSETEFSMFVHPDRHEAMLGHLVQEQLNRLDSDGDRRVSFDEYMSEYGSRNNRMMKILSRTAQIAQGTTTNTV